MTSLLSPRSRPESIVIAQLAFIGDLAKEVGLDRSELDAICRRAVGQKLSAALSRFDGSRLIGLLQDLASGKVRREEVLS